MVILFLFVFLTKLYQPVHTTLTSNTIRMQFLNHFQNPSSTSIIFKYIDNSPLYISEVFSEPLKTFFEPQVFHITCPLFFMIILMSFTIIIIIRKIFHRKKPQNQYYSSKTWKLSEASTRSTAVSLFPSPVFSITSEHSCFFPSLNSHSSIDLISDNKNFNKNFINQGILWENPMETVYIATHRLDSQQYLVKAIPFEINLVENLREQRIFQEINKIKQLRCKYLTRYVTCWLEFKENTMNFTATEVCLFVQMEYITGESLKTWLSTKFNQKTSIKIIRKVGKVLKYLHSLGLPHGGISLDNIFIDKYQTVVIGDFDFTTHISEDLHSFAEVVRSILQHFPSEHINKAADQVVSLDCLQELGISNLFSLTNNIN